MRSTFTPQARGTILQGLYAGLTLGEAIERAGLGRQTGKNWLTRGRKDIDHGVESAHASFALAVDEARDVAARADLSVAEFRGCVAKAVRAGSIAAMRLWLELQDREAPDDLDDPFVELDRSSPVIDRLARRRTQPEDDYEDDQEGT